MTSTTTHEASYRLEGMTCTACARRVTKAAEKVEGVAKIEVDLVRERAVVAFDREKTDALEGALTAAVERAGYRLIATEVTARQRAARDHRGAIAVVLAIGALTLDLTGHPGLALAMALASWLGPGQLILRRAWAELRDRQLGMDTLLALGTTAAVAGGALALAFDGHHASHGHSDASMAALLVAISMMGKTLERSARARAAAAIEGLAAELPTTARVVRHGQEADVPLSELRAGDRVKVAPFAKVATDGVIASGEPELDESLVSGESRPVTRREGARVRGGSQNLGVAFELVVEEDGGRSELARIRALVERAQSGRGAAQRLADRVSRVFVPIVVLVALGAGIGHVAMGSAPLDALRIAISVLVVACPCALGLATPVALTVAVGHAARLGLLVRDADVLDRLASVRTMVFDKTGTLTEGLPKVRAIELVDGVVRTASIDEATALAWAAALETESLHPIGRAIFSEAMTRGLTVPTVAARREIPGVGIEGRLGGELLTVGRPRDGRGKTWLESGHSVAELADAQGPIALFALRDRVRAEVPATLVALRDAGIRSVVRSGDAVEVVRDLAAELGVDDAEGGLSPDDKLRSIEELEGPTAMIGDGINDAPALARADVGIAVGARVGTTLEAAGAILLHESLATLPPALVLAKKTRRVVAENLVLAFAYNVVALPLAAVGIVDHIGGPALAAVAMAGSSIAVVVNALRLR